MKKKSIKFAYYPDSVRVAELSIDYKKVCLFDSSSWIKTARPYVCVESLMGEWSKEVYVDKEDIPENPRDLYDYLLNFFDNVKFESA